jgi:phenylacetate-CoA ligase
MTVTHDRRDVDRKFYDEAAQTLTKADLTTIQERRLSEAVQRAFELAPFFRRRFIEGGARPEDIRGIDDLTAFPICEKADLRQSEARVPPFGDYRCTGIDSWVRLTTSTGTTGRPTFAAWTRNDLELDYELSARASWRIGLRPGMVVVTAQPGYLVGADAFIIGDCQHMGMLPISLGPPDSVESAARALRAIHEIPVDHWRVFPTALHRFQEAARRYGIPVALPEGEESGPRQLFHKLSGGQECISVLGGACQEKNGAHLAEDFAVVEVLDLDTGQPVPEGQRGQLVVTSLGRENPMIRYNVGDVVTIDSAPCPCGETSRRGFYQGRVKDVVRVGDTKVLPIDVWFELPDDAEFVLVRSPHQQELTVRVEGGPDPDLRTRLEARLGVPTRLEWLPSGTLPRASYKPVRVIDAE